MPHLHDLMIESFVVMAMYVIAIVFMWQTPLMAAFGVDGLTPGLTIALAIITNVLLNRRTEHYIS